MTDEATWPTNKILMTKLWPKWKPTPEQANLLNERWGQLKQDILRECIRNNAMQSRREPHIAAIHRAYCKATAVPANAAESHEVERTRRSLSDCQRPSEDHYAEWDAWANELLANATREEIAEVTERLGVKPATNRILAVMVEYARTHKRKR